MMLATLRAVCGARVMSPQSAGLSTLGTRVITGGLFSVSATVPSQNASSPS